MSVARYLAAHYWTPVRLAMACGIAETELDSLVVRGLVPAPSYRVDRQGVLTSVVFGEFADTDAAPGTYFHPGTARWVRRATRVIARIGREKAVAPLRRGFELRFAAELRRMDRELLRIDDCFAPDGTGNESAIRARCGIAWTHLMDGTFGLCVRDVASVAAIARKELLQEHLTRYAGMNTIEMRDLPALQTLLETYAEAAMPFSPVEYAASSRKRLVEDFGSRLRALRTGVSRDEDASSQRADESMFEATT